MKFSTMEERRPITDEEREEGLKWLVANGFEFHGFEANGETHGWFVRESALWSVRVNKPINGWAVRATLKKSRGQHHSDGMSFCECTTAEEAVKDAQDSCFRPKSARQLALEESERDFMGDVARYWSGKANRKRKTTRRR